MTTELKDMLCQYLGELMAESDSTFDWHEKELILQKIDALNLLLDVPTNGRRLTWIEKVMDAVKDIKP